jgi:predicted naringenin-chalcone synthase
VQFARHGENNLSLSYRCNDDETLNLYYLNCPQPTIRIFKVLSSSTPTIAGARIVAIASSAPDYSPSQQTIFDKIYREAFSNVSLAESLFCNTGVKTRRVYYDSSAAEAGDRISTSKRMQIWKAGAMQLGRRTLDTVFSQTDRAKIGSFVMVSSTGYDAPSPDILLAREFAMSPRLHRTFIGHMGCQSAFNGIKVALDSLAARPDEAVLVKCTEISSAHVRTDETTKEQIVCQALFGDASAAIVLARTNTSNGPEILCTHTETLYDHSGELTLSIGDQGFRMTLSPLVPSLIGGAVAAFVERMLAPLGLRTTDICHWGIHPGGPKIVELTAQALSLNEEQTCTSLGVLADYGNCASPTILLILERILKIERPLPGKLGVLLAFGPGLTIEGAVLRF